MSHAEDVPNQPEFPLRAPESKAIPLGPPLPPRGKDLPQQTLRNSPGPAAGPGFGSYLLNSILALVFGIGGALGYERFHTQAGENRNPALSDEQADGGKTPPKSSETANPANPATSVASAVTPTMLSERIDQLAEKLDGLRSKVEEKPNAPLPATASDVQKLREGVNDLQQVMKPLAPLPAKVQNIDTKVEEMTLAIETARDDIVALKGQLKNLTLPSTAARDESPSTRSGEGRRDEEVKRSAGAATPTPTESTTGRDPVAVERNFTRGAGLYRKGLFKEASEVFTELEQAIPDDARVWYYAALSNGFAKNNWAGDSVRLVEKGVTREQAGTPKTADIDTEFKDLTTANGKDWLAAYRKRANDKR